MNFDQATFRLQPADEILKESEAFFRDKGKRIPRHKATVQDRWLQSALVNS